MIKEDWSKSLFDVGLLDYKNKNNKQEENTWKALQITRILNCRVIKQQ